MVDDGGERRSVFADRYMSSRRRREIVKRLYVLLALAVCGVVSWSVMISMPGKSFRGAPLPLLPPELILRDELAAHVQKLAGEIGERNMAHYSKLGVAADYIEAFRSSRLQNLAAASEFTKTHPPAVVAFYRREGETDVRLPWRPTNMTTLAQIGKHNPALL